MTLARRPRRVAACLAAGALGLLTLGVLPACGSAGANLTVTLSHADKTKAKPGANVNYVAELSNDGPGQATGVTLRVDLPTAFRYVATPSIDTKGVTTRTQPSDPLVGTDTPQWGQWAMAAPGINADGTPARSVLDITFTVQAGGKPGDYPLTPHAFNEGGDEVVGKDLSVHLFPASDLSLALVVDETVAKRGDTVHYHVTVLNQGSGPARGVGLLITLPSQLVFDSTEHKEGNFSRANPIDPVAGALIVYYGGFVLPAASDARPGALTILFTAKVLPTAQGGRYSVTAQLTDADGAVVSLGDVAPLTITAPTPSPVPSPTATLRATARPAPTAYPSPTPTPKHGG